MKLSKRAGIIGSTIVVVVATATTGYIMSKPDPKPRNDNAPILIDQKDKSLVPLAVENATEAPTKPATPPAEDEPTPAPKPVSSAVYGEDPNKPGWFKVFDPDKFMEMNGTVPLADRPVAKQVIEKLSGWYYNKPGTEKNAVLLCNSAMPVGGMQEQPDYSSQPVSTFGKCQRLALSKGGWQAWLNTL